jgi:hypothetical protein
MVDLARWAPVQSDPWAWVQAGPGEKIRKKVEILLVIGLFLA